MGEVSVPVPGLGEGAAPEASGHSMRLSVTKNKLYGECAYQTINDILHYFSWALGVD